MFTEIYFENKKKYNRLSETKAQNLINTANRRDVMRKGEKERFLHLYNETFIIRTKRERKRKKRDTI